MESAEQILFVYGSLRPALARGEPARLIAGLDHLGRASVPGRLYDLGEYPGLVAGSGLVHGDILVVPARRLALLDDYEECRGSRPLFRRVRLTATQEDGSTCRAWVYRYARPVTGGRLVLAGDYLAHLDRGRLGQP